MGRWAYHLTIPRPTSEVKVYPPVHGLDSTSLVFYLQYGLFRPFCSDWGPAPNLTISIRFVGYALDKLQKMCYNNYIHPMREIPRVSTEDWLKNQPSGLYEIAS
jgi:hypothetical protein